MKDKVRQYIKLIEEKTGSKTFCCLPWIHVATRPNGDARLCCGSNASGASTGDYTVGLVKKENGEPSNYGKDTIENSFNNDYMKSVRLSMLNSEIPSSCSKCFEEEQNNVASKRLWELYEWEKDGLDIKELIDSTSSDGSVPFKIQYMDLRLGNTCNLKCVMCSPHDSSRWMQDYDKVMTQSNSKIVKLQLSFDKENYDNNWYSQENFLDELFQQIPNIKQLYFAGGEPLMIKEHRRILDEIIRRGYAKDISLRYNSNGTFVDEDIINVWKQFKQVRYAFSIDSLFERNHYIRYPALWADVERTLELMDNTPDNIHCSIACAVQVLNIKHLVDFAKWKIQKKYKKINQYKVDEYLSGGGIINLHLVYIPTFMSARVLPKQDKLEIHKLFNDFKQWLYDNYTTDTDFWETNPYGWKRWESILNFIDAEDHSNILPDTIDYLKNIDNIRQLDSRTIFPELSHLF